jgi:hypothetical protein
METNTNTDKKDKKKLSNFTSKTIFLNFYINFFNFIIVFFNFSSYYFLLLLVSLIAGGLAGVVVDIGLFPVDTIKTRIQSEKSSLKVSKNNIYKGVTSMLLGSFPSAATFFISYDYTNKFLKKCKYQYKYHIALIYYKRL